MARRWVKARRVRLDFLVSDTDRCAIASYGFTRGYHDEIEVNSRGLATDRGVRTWMFEQLRLELDDIAARLVCVDELGCRVAGDHAEHDEPLSECPNDRMDSETMVMVPCASCAADDAAGAERLAQIRDGRG